MRTIGRLLLSAIFLVLTALLVLVAKYAPALVFSFYPELSRKALGVISAVTSAVPLAVWELLAGLAILWLLYTFVRIFTQHRSFLCWLAGIVLGVCVGLFVFVALWGLNHFGPSVGEQLGLSVREYTKQELQKATEYYAAQVNRLSGLVPRDADSLARAMTSWRSGMRCSQALMTRSKSLPPGACSASSASRAFLSASRARRA